MGEFSSVVVFPWGSFPCPLYQIVLLEEQWFVCFSHFVLNLDLSSNDFKPSLDATKMGKLQQSQTFVPSLAEISGKLINC